MSHPLDGARLKIVRAEQHLNAFKVDVAKYMNSQPYTLPVEHDGHTVSVGNAVITKAPPLLLSCIVGDCLVNLRASLDYVSWQLAGRYNPKLSASDRLMFPLAKDASTFNLKRRPELAKHRIPAAVISLIESMQPYNAGYERLSDLSLLCNVDKHVLPLLTISTAKTYQLSMRFNEGVSVSSSGGRLSMNLNAGPPGSNPMNPEKMQVDGDIAVFVSLQDFLSPAEPVDIVLEQIIKCVASIIPRFDSLV